MRETISTTAIQGGARRAGRVSGNTRLGCHDEDGFLLIFGEQGPPG
jgi:hypothetical protein